VSDDPNTLISKEWVMLVEKSVCSARSSLEKGVQEEEEFI